MIPDSHVHLDLIELEPERVISDARAAGVSPVITIGINVSSSREAVSLAESIESVYASVGIHPNDTGDLSPKDLDRLGEIAGSSERVVAIGETGLDYYRDRSPVSRQKESFRAHVKLARRLGKALIVHDRQAHDDVLEILKEETAGDIPVVMHCFSGGPGELEECRRRDYFISFAGPVTFKNAARAREVASRVPLDRLLVETDSPFLSPEPFRGKSNLPERARFVADVIARLHSISPTEFDEILEKNCEEAFGIERARR